MQKVYLSRTNLLALLSKLDRNLKNPGSSGCTIIKRDTLHPVYPCSATIAVIALEDAEYYSDREPGPIHPADDPKEK